LVGGLLQKTLAAAARQPRQSSAAKPMLGLSRNMTLPVSSGGKENA
jgi:hypothetical protein